MGQPLTIDKFMELLLEAARKCGEDAMVAAIEREGARCQLFRHCRSAQSAERVSDALDEQLRLTPGFKPDFRTPSDALDGVGSASHFFWTVCDIAELPDRAAATLQFA